MTHEQAFAHFERERDAAHLAEYLADRAAQHDAEDNAYLARLFATFDRHGSAYVSDCLDRIRDAFPVGFVDRHTVKVYRHGVRQVHLRRDLWAEAA